jgi:hypothetical protein
VVEYAVNNTAVRNCTSVTKKLATWEPSAKGHILKVRDDGTSCSIKNTQITLAPCSSVLYSGIRFGDADRGVPKLGNPSGLTLEKGQEVEITAPDFIQVYCTVITFHIRSSDNEGSRWE